MEKNIHIKYDDYLNADDYLRTHIEELDDGTPLGWMREGLITDLLAILLPTFQITLDNQGTEAEALDVCDKEEFNANDELAETEKMCEFHGITATILANCSNCEIRNLWWNYREFRKDISSCG